MKLTIEVDVPERECLRCKRREAAKVGSFVSGWGNVPSEIREPEGWQRVSLLRQEGLLCGACAMGFIEWMQQGEPK